MNQEAQKLLDTYVVASQPTATAAAASLRAIEGRLAAGDPGMLSGVGSSGKLALATKAFVAGAVLAGALAYVLLSEDSEDPKGVQPVAPVSTALSVEDPPTPTVPESGVLPGQLEKAQAEVEVEVEPEPRVELARPPAAKKKMRTKARPKPSVDETSAVLPISALKEEMALLAKGQRALQAGNAAEALRQFELHRERFPKGSMRAEREVKMVVALCELGRTREARTRRARFLKSHPGSSLAASLAEVCSDE